MLRSVGEAEDPSGGTSDEPEGSIKMDSVSAITVGLGHKGPNSDSGETYCQSF